MKQALILTAHLEEERKSLEVIYEKALAQVLDVSHRRLIGEAEAAIEDRKLSALYLELKTLKSYIRARKVCDDLEV